MSESTTITKVRVGKGSRIVAERWYYDPTYLHTPDEDDAWLTVRHFAVIETKARNRSQRMKFGVEYYPDTQSMVAAIEQRHMSEAPQEYNDDRSWIPPELVGARL